MIRKNTGTQRKNAVLNKGNHQIIHWITFASQIYFRETVTLNRSKFDMQQQCAAPL